MRHGDSLATILLASRLCVEGVQPFKASEYWRLLEAIGAVEPASFGQGTLPVNGHLHESSFGALVLKGEHQLVRDYGLSDETAARIARLSQRATALAFELERLEKSGIHTVTAFDERYPSDWRTRLEAKAPPLMHAAGALELFDTLGLGVVGSRDASQAGGQVARDVACLAARRGIPLVSGGARGVDQMAMDAAFKADGSVVGILAESLSRKLKRSDVRRAVHDGDTVMCSPYSPEAPFSAGNAMGRNKLIYAQTALTVVVASADGSGGTWSGATEALKHGYGNVAVWRGDGEGPGNAKLENQGAIPVTSLQDIEEILENGIPETQPTAPSAPAPKQQSLFAASMPT